AGGDTGGQHRQPVADADRAFPGRDRRSSVARRHGQPVARRLARAQQKHAGDGEGQRDHAVFEDRRLTALHQQLVRKRTHDRYSNTRSPSYSNQSRHARQRFRVTSKRHFANADKILGEYWMRRSWAGLFDHTLSSPSPRKRRPRSDRIPAGAGMARNERDGRSLGPHGWRGLASRASVALRRDREVRCDAGAAPATVSGEIATSEATGGRV